VPGQQSSRWLQYNEYIVFDPSRIKLRYMVLVKSKAAQLKTAAEIAAANAKVKAQAAMSIRGAIRAAVSDSDDSDGDNC
jgi:hypothetical protein